MEPSLQWAPTSPRAACHWTDDTGGAVVQGAAGKDPLAIGEVGLWGCSLCPCFFLVSVSYLGAWSMEGVQ